MSEIAKLLDNITPRQAEQLIYEMERRGLVKRWQPDQRMAVLEAEVQDYKGLSWRSGGCVMKAVSLEEYRRDALRTYPYELARNERRDYAAMKLVEEAAEFMALVNKSHYQDTPCTREQIRDELGDVLWALMVNATEHGLTLEEIMLANMAKRSVRYPKGV